MPDEQQPYHIRIFHNHGSRYFTEPEEAGGEVMPLEDWLTAEGVDEYQLESIEEISHQVTMESMSHGIRVTTARVN